MITVQVTYNTHVGTLITSFKINFKKIIILQLNNQWFSVSDNQYVSKLCFNEALIIVDNDGKELGEFIGKIRRCNSNNSTASIMINVHSTNISENGEEIGMNLITKTTAKFDSYEEKWSQWLLLLFFKHNLI